MGPTTKPPEADRADWARPLRVLRLARRVGVTPWEALGWLESVLRDFEAHGAALGDGGPYAAPEGAPDGLPWPPGD